MRTQKNHPRLFGTGPGWVALLCLAVLAWTGIATAQLPAPVTPWAFDVDGFIQEAKLDGASGGALQGGHIKVNGHMITVPSSTVVVLPGNELTWQELFAQAPAPYGPTQTGMAANDLPVPLVQYEAHVIGNVEPGNAPLVPCTILTCSGEYVAGLVYISQQGTNTGSGYINFIDYVNGELLVGGTPGSSTDGTRVRLNDPTGKFGRANAAGSTDPRFSIGSLYTPGTATLDSSNPTVRSVTGFPMCLPRTDPAVAGDALCPQSQRPALGAGVGQFTTNDPATGLSPTPFLQAPFEIGDYVTFAGTLVQDCAITGCPLGGPTTGPYPVPVPAPGKANTFISAHTITNNIAIYTFPGKDPSYVAIDVALMGTGGTTVLGLNEAAIRTRFEGFTTDISRGIHLYGVDLACNGTESGLRDWGTIGVDQGPPTGAQKGRWRFRPPCTGVASSTTTAGTVTDKVCSPPVAGVFDPPPRDVRAVLEVFASPVPAPTGTTAIPAWVPGQTTQAAGIIYGQAHIPIGDYIFPEQVVGNPVPPDNFESMAFLFNGGVMSTAGTLSTGLNPWPTGGVAPPASTCAGAPPTVTASADVLTVTAGQVVTLTAVATGLPAPTITWNWTGTTAGTFSSTTGATVTWTAPSVLATETANFTATATNSSGSATSAPPIAVTVNPPAANPTVTATASPTTVNANGTVTLSAIATGNPAPTLTWSQTGGTTGTFSSTTGTPVTWTAPATVTVTETATFLVTATNGVLPDATATVSVTVNPAGVAPTVTVTASPTLVNSAGVVTLSAVTTGTPAPTLTWTQTAGTVGTFSATTGTPVTWTAPNVLVAETATFTVTATNGNPPDATATVSVRVAPPPTVTATATPGVVASNGTVALSATATGVAPITLVWSQTAGPLGTFSSTTGTPVNWTAPAVGAFTPATFLVTATAANGTVTALVSITINPVQNPVIAPIAAQTALLGSAVSIPVTVTSTNTKAILNLAATPTAFTGFLVNKTNQTCTATGCTAAFTVTFTAPNVAQVITFTMTATDTSVTPNATSAPALAVVTVQAVPVIQHVTPITVISGNLATVPVVVTSQNPAAIITLAAVQTTAFTIVPSPPAVSQTAKTCTATGCTFNFNVTFTRTLPTAPLQVTNDVIQLTLTATDSQPVPALVSASEFTTVTVTPIADTMTITSVVDRTAKQRVIVNVTDTTISPNLVLKVQPYVCNGGAAACPGNGPTPVPGVYDPCAGVGCTMNNNGGGLYIITMVGAPPPVCRAVGGTFATPCTAPAITVKSNIGGTGGPSVITLIRKN